MEETHTQNIRLYDESPIRTNVEEDCSKGRAKNRNLKMRDAVQTMLRAKIKNNDLCEELRDAGFKGTLTYRDLLIYRLFIKAMSGSTESVAAFKEIRSLAGEAESFNVNLTVAPTLEDQARRITAALNEYRVIE
jgi:hypothetical protein